MQELFFKEIMGKFPTGVTVISANLDGKLFGFTANSFTSVSLNPSLISFCLSKDAGSIKAFLQTGKFAISILAENQINISKHFASSKFDKFNEVNSQLGNYSKCPLIKGAVCWIECDKIFEYEGGDHLIFVGKTIEASINNDLRPLVYFARGYHSLQ